MTKRHRRETFTGRDIGLPELELFGWNLTASATDSRLTRHRHENAFEICLIARGRVEWWVEDESYELRRGAAYVTQPGEAHGAVDGVMNPCELYWLILPHPGRKPLPGLDANETRMLCRDLSQLRHRTFPASRALQSRFRQLHEEARSPDSLSPLAARAVLHDLLVQVLRDHRAACSATDDSRRSRAIARATGWVREHLGEEISVAAMARIAGMSPSRFHDRFLEETGQTPSEYLTWTRILAAKERLTRTAEPVSTIAFDLGFSSSQYFATVFRKYVGVSPAQYRQSGQRSRVQSNRMPRTRSREDSASA